MHQSWFKRKVNADLFISYFGDKKDRYKSECKYYEAKKGPKWSPIYDLINRNWKDIKYYNSIWFPDDDLTTTPEDINRFFELFDEYNLWIAQPALKRKSYFNHSITRKHPNSIIRFTNFVEVMAPAIAPKQLQKLMPSIKESKSGWGLDHVWPIILGLPTRKIAIIDDATITHARPMGGPLYVALKKEKVNYKAERNHVLKKYGKRRTTPYKYVYHLVTKDGSDPIIPKATR